MAKRPHGQAGAWSTGYMAKRCMAKRVHGEARKGRAATSPDSRPLLRCEIELIAGLHVKSPIPGIHVPHHAVDPIHHRRMRVRYDLLADRGGGRFLAPGLGVAQEEALVP